MKISQARVTAHQFCSLWLLFAALFMCPVPASAQSVPAPPNPSSVDSRGVNLLTGGLVINSVDLTIGPADYHGLNFSRQLVGSGTWRIADLPTISGSTASPIVSYGGRSIPFQTVSGVYVPVFADGSTLDSTRTTFTASDGTVIQFGVAGYQYPMFEQTGSGGLGTQITYPDGTIWTFTYNLASYTGIVQGCYVDQFGDPCMETYYVARLSSIASSTGYQIKLTYASDTVSDNASFYTWSSITQATALNNSVEYCDPAALNCSFTNTWSHVTYTVNGTLYNQFTSKTDPIGTTTYSYSGNLSGIKPPGAASDMVGYTYTSGKVTSVLAGAGTWTYTYPSGTQTTVTDPASNVQTVNYDSTGLVTSLVAGGQTTAFTYYAANDPNGPVNLLQQVTSPEQNYTIYTYDARGNPLTATTYPKPGSGTLPSSIVTSAIYPSACTNQKTCNKPTSTTDARGQVTDYAYDPATGAVTSVKLPADPSGVRPETRVGYGTVYAWSKNSSGTLVQGPAMTLPTSSSQCRIGTATTCVGTADEKLTTIAYPTSGPSNGQPSSVTVKAGNNTLVETTALTYNNFGEVLTIDGPLAGAGDTTRIRYDTVGRLIGKVAPAPGVDSLADMAIKYSYDAWGHVSLVQTGTVTDQTDTAWNNFTETNRVSTSFDSYGRAVRQKSSSSGGTTDYAVTDAVYDPNGRVWCTIVRMDPAQWGTIATTCSPPQTNGPNGPDRVTKNSYDALDRVTKVTTAVGITGVTADDVTTTYTPNGQVLTQVDAKGNTTTYSYDGYDRLTQTAYPLGSTELISYDLPTDANNRAYFTTRRGEQLTLYRDNLGRVTKKVVPERSGLDRTNTRDVFYSYDLLGDVTAACFGSTTSTPETITTDCDNYTFDALGRQLAETQVMNGTSLAIASAYANDNSRTQITHPDGNYFNYYRDNLGRNYYTALNASSPLFYPARNSYGQTATLYRWNTTSAAWDPNTSFSYDPVSRLSSLVQGLAGTSYDSTTTLTYNPASQITSQARTNDAYAWGGGTNVNRPYVPNALNQYASIASIAQTFDGNGNLTSDGTNSYVYDVENRLVSATIGSTTATLRYDPLGRLYEVNGSATGITRFLNDGDDLIAEYNSSGTLLRRYVHGDTAGDDPLVWFEGSGVADTARRYLYSDERGSVVAITDSSGTVTNVNTYDEYGIPGASNVGRFQYTGQAWIPELGMSYYKARMYSPTLGRFMQTDPIGYGDGMNMYRYVHSDPVNGVDPTGLFCCIDVWGRSQLLPPPGVPGGGGVGGGTASNDPPPLPSGVGCENGPLAALCPSQNEAPKKSVCVGSRGARGQVCGKAAEVMKKEYHCAVGGLKKNRVALGIDAASIIPGEGMLSELANLVGSSVTMVLSVFDEHPAGGLVLSGASGTTSIAALNKSDPIFSKRAAEAVPVAGSIFGAAATANDLKHAFDEEDACMGRQSK